MFQTNWLSHGSDNLALLLDELQNQVVEAREYRNNHFQSWAIIDGQTLLDSENIRFFRIGEGHYRYEFIQPYKNDFYAFSFNTEHMRVIKVSKAHIEVKCLEDQDLRLSCTGRI